MKYGESKGIAFKRLAIRRTNVVLDKLRLLGNLSSRSNYEYSSEEIDKIFKAVHEQLNHTKQRFYRKERKKFELQ